jgi:hypothetical protein
MDVCFGRYGGVCIALSLSLRLFSTLFFASIGELSKVANRGGEGAHTIQFHPWKLALISSH